MTKGLALKKILIGMLALGLGFASAETKHLNIAEKEIMLLKAELKFEKNKVKQLSELMIKATEEEFKRMKVMQNTIKDLKNAVKKSDIVIENLKKETR